MAMMVGNVTGLSFFIVFPISLFRVALRMIRLSTDKVQLFPSGKLYFEGFFISSKKVFFPYSRIFNFFGLFEVVTFSFIKV